MATTIKARGTWETAVSRACDYGNRFARAERMERAERFLARAGWGRSTFGREYVGCGEVELCYLNSGDTYTLTVCQEHNGQPGKLFASDWGSWLETAEQEHEQETDTIRCGYCGHFTPLCAKALAQPEGARHSWRETVCESCGHHVDGSK